MKKMRFAILMATIVGLSLTGLPRGHAEHSTPATPDLAKLASLWSPRPDLNNKSNWRTYNAYNVVHHVAHNLPNRQPDDQTSNDPDGDLPTCALGDVVESNCQYNHQLEYLKWYEVVLGDILRDFGVTFRTYQFTSTGDSGGLTATNPGRAFNKLAIVPGAEHPEDIVLIGTHYDGVDGSPMAAWDSTAGTGVLVRTAKMLVDYWKSTGTRPAATYVFAAWDAEEAGGQGSKLYVGTKDNKGSQDGTLPKDPNATLTLYINHDPCGGHYPAFYRGSPASRNPLVEKTGFIPMNVALHAPQGTTAEKARMTAFNSSVPGMINQLFNAIDDTLSYSGVAGEPGAIPVFLSREEAALLGSEALEQESVLKVTTKGLLFFTTDAEDFHKWVPTLNPYPDNVGPHAVSTTPQDLGWGPDGLWAYHSPHDNFEQLVAQTSADQSGQTYSHGLAQSWEFCATFSAWAMMQPAQGGLAPVDNRPVAFFETPKPNQNGGVHTFDASGSYRYADPASRSFDPTLEYLWSFGDGTTAAGKIVTHQFPNQRGHRVTLTVRDPETGMTDSMDLKIGVAPI